MPCRRPQRSHSHMQALLSATGTTRALRHSLSTGLRSSTGAMKGARVPGPPLLVETSSKRPKLASNRRQIINQPYASCSNLFTVPKQCYRTKTVTPHSIVPKISRTLLVPSHPSRFNFGTVAAQHSTARNRSEHSVFRFSAAGTHSCLRNIFESALAIQLIVHSVDGGCSWGTGQWITRIGVLAPTSTQCSPDDIWYACNLLSVASSLSPPPCVLGFM